MRRSLARVLLLSAVSVSLAATGLGAGLSPAAGAGSTGDPYGTVWNILPPGESGTINAADLAMVGPSRVAVDGENAPPNFADQLEMYDALTSHKPRSLTRSDIDDLFKRAGFTPETVVSSDTPRSGTTIEWDQFGVPYITGDTYSDVMFGAGFAAVHDRMFLMDALRHAGKGDLASFAGATPGNLAMDAEQMRTAYYTEQEASDQIRGIALRYGSEGQQLIDGLDAFLLGINAGQDALCPGGNVLAPSCPVEYSLLGQTVKPWFRSDIVYIASLVGGIFGKGGGHELANAYYLEQLQKKFGAKKGRAIYRDLRTKYDKESPTTASVSTRYGGGPGLNLGLPGVALPDLNGKSAPGSGTMLSSTSASSSGAPAARPSIDLPGGSIEVPLHPHGMSNAVLVSAKHSATGSPLTVFGPQTSYYTPQLLSEEVLKGPGVLARGVSFAGTNLVVELGRGLDYAWSATSASLDNIDTVVERLCNTDGSPATVDSEGYMDRGKCKPMDHFEPSYTAVPSAGSQEPPSTYTYLVLRTRHGIVQTRTTVDGKPVAIVLQRSTYGHEVDSAIGFARFNNPDYVHNAKSFEHAASAIDYTFNWFYTDDRDIAYYASGLIPKRAEGVAFDFPRWGNRRYDWQGYVGFKGHVKQINPPSGYFVSWNNRQAPNWAAPDDIWAWGSVHRSLALEDRLKKRLRSGKRLQITDVVGVMAGAAYQDSRARYTLPWLLKVIGKDPKTAEARTYLRQWLRAGAPRVDRDQDGAYSHQQAIAIFDDWWQDGDNSVAYDVMKGLLGAELTGSLPQILDNHPREGIGSSWLDSPWYSYLNKDLRMLLGKHVRSPLRYSYCGNGTLTSCRKVLRASLQAAVQRVLAAQGVSDVADLTYDKTQDDIVSSTSGAVGVRPIDWQNRPTFQQVVEFISHRPR